MALSSMTGKFEDIINRDDCPWPELGDLVGFVDADAIQKQAALLT
jgi:hypothetical protein